MKNNPSVIAKITPPRLSGITRRERLFALLDKGAEKSLTWVTASGGSGKSTLVASWLEAKKLPGLWLQLDVGDSDAATFFYYFGLAAQKATPRKKKQLPLLTPEYLRNASTFSRRFFEELCARFPQPPFVLVFDNYQEVAADSVLHDLFLQGIESLPAGAAAIVISRADPPAQFTRLRANGSMAIVGWNELRFTLDEVRDAVEPWRSGHCLARDCPGPDLLFEKTDGWAAGLRLMIEAAEPQRDIVRNTAPDQPVCHCVGNLAWKDNVFSYFACEVMNRSDHAICDLLTATSFLPFVTSSIAGKLTGRDDAAAVLSDLSRRNFFTEWHPGPVPVYRYHPLFREFLRNRAAESLAPGEVRRLKKTGAALLAAAGFTQEAIDLYCEVQEFDRAEPLILRQARPLLSQGRGRSVESWLAALPRERVDHNPSLQLIAGLCRLTSDLGEARALLGRAFAGFEERRDHPSAILAAGGYLESLSVESSSLAEVDLWIDRITEAARQEGQEVEAAADRAAGSVLMALGFHRLRHPAVGFWRDKAERAMMTALDASSRLKICNHLMTYYFVSGDFVAMARGMTVVKALRREAEAVPALRVLCLLMESYYVVHAEGDDRKGIELARQGLEAGRECGVTIYGVWLSLLIAAAAVHIEDQALADETVNAMMAWAPALSPLRLADLYHAAGLASAGRRAWQEARDFFERGVEIAQRVQAPFTEAYLRVETAKALFVLNDEKGARRQLAQVIDGQWAGSELIRYREEITTAHFDLQAGDREEGLRKLAVAFGRARRNAIRFVQFADRQTFAQLCAEALAAGIESEFVRDVIRRHDLLPPADESAAGVWPWPVRIYAMGRFQIFRDDAPVEFTGKTPQKPLELLKTLIALGGESVAEERLTDFLWPDAEGDLAHQSFESALSRLRRILGGDDRVRYSDRQLSLNFRRCWVDSIALGRLLNKASDGKGEQAQRTFNEAAGLYNGHFLPADGGREWSVSRSEKLRNGMLRLSVEAGREYELTEQWEQAAACYQKALEADQLAEGVYRSLMICYAKLGRRSEAVNVYHRCGRLLRKHLGVQPSSETESVYSALLSE